MVFVRCACIPRREGRTTTACRKKNHHGKSSRAPNAVSCASLRPTLTASCVFSNVGSRVAPARVCLCFVCVCVCAGVSFFKKVQSGPDGCSLSGKKKQAWRGVPWNPIAEAVFLSCGLPHQLLVSHSFCFVSLCDDQIFLSKCNWALNLYGEASPKRTCSLTIVFYDFPFHLF